jgi:hypothetical protein
MPASSDGRPKDLLQPRALQPMQPRKQSLAPAAATLLFMVMGSTAAAQIPSVPNPGTSTPVGPPSAPQPYNTARVGNATSGSMYFSQGTTTTQKFTGVSCAQVTPQACGGQFSVSAGAEFSLFGVTITIGMDWTANEQDHCKLCAVFLCANSTTTKTTRKGKTWYQNGLGQNGPQHDYEETTSVTIPDPASATLMLNCDDSDAAREFCCPEGKDKDEEEDGPGGEDGLLAPGDLVALPDQYAFGSGYPLAAPLDFLDVAAIVEVDLRTVSLLPGQAWESGADAPNEWRHIAHQASHVSLAQRHAIAHQIYVAFDLGNPSAPIPAGHVLVALTEDGGASYGIDLGTVYDIVVLDTLRLGHPADIDMNGAVTTEDLDIVLEDLTAPSTEARGDVNLDGWVTDEDLDLVLAAM